MEKKIVGLRPAQPEKITQPARAQTVNWWWLVSALTVALILALGTLFLIRDLARVFALLILGIAIANALAPVVNWLEKHLHLPRPAAILVVYLILVVLFAAVIWTMIPVVITQVKALGQQINAWVPQITSWLSQFGLDASTLIGSFSSIASRLGDILLSLPTTFFSALLDFVLVIFISLYWLILMNGIRGFFLSFYPVASHSQYQAILSETGRAMGGYLRGAAIDGAIFGILKYIGLVIIGVPYALTLGVLAAVLEFFPTIGAIFSASVATLVALSVSPTLALITLVFTLILQQLENHILVPLVMRSQTSISPLLAVLAVVAGGAIGGILGAVVGIPIISALDVLIRMVIAPAVRKANGVKKRQEEEENEETVNQQ
jgi:predicted PurR-regulated permease PerM